MTDPLAPDSAPPDGRAAGQRPALDGAQATPETVAPLATWPPEDIAGAHPGTPANILLVDDHAENLLALEAVLEPLQQRLVLAHSGEEALRRLLHEEFAVVLLDVRMPGIDGFETARYIGARQRTRHIPIIFLTAREADVDQVFAGYAAGAVDYVVKPFDPGVLRSKVSVFVNLYRERSERIREARGRSEAEAIVATVRKLQSLSDAALAHLEMEDLLSELLERTRALFDADTAGLLLAGRGGEMMKLRATHGLEPLGSDTVVSAGEGFLGTLLRSSEPGVLDSVDEGAALHASLAATGVRSVLGAPLASAGEPLGVLYVGSRSDAHFSDEDAVLMGLGAERASIAIDHARSYERERGLVETLQRSLLPERLPQVDRLLMAARYRPSGDAAQVGGDWYDAIMLPDGRVGLAIGDVVGHGVRAATIMGELRNALRAYVMEGHSAGQAVQRLNALVEATHEEAMVATLAFVLLDPGTGAGSLVSAGHLPPLMLMPDGRTSYLEKTPAPPLGVSRAHIYAEHELQLEPGSTLVFYTDGLVERRGESLDIGLKDLRDAVSTGPADLEELCSHVLTALQEGSAWTDDVAVLVVRLVASPLGGVSLRLPAEPASVTVARRALERLLEEAGANADDSFALRLAISEACANAVEHAYGPGDHEFDVEARLDNGEIEVVVRDGGRWRVPRGKGRGLGLKLVEQLNDTLKIEKGDTGTSLHVTKRLAGADPPPGG